MFKENITVYSEHYTGL